MTCNVFERIDEAILEVYEWPDPVDTQKLIGALARRGLEICERRDTDADELRPTLAPEVCGRTCPEHPEWTCARTLGHFGRHESADGGDWWQP